MYTHIYIYIYIHIYIHIYIIRLTTKSELYIYIYIHAHSSKTLILSCANIIYISVRGCWKHKWDSLMSSISDNMLLFKFIVVTASIIMSRAFTT